MSEQKRFDDFNVECNDCSHYWNDTCDGVPYATESRQCTSFKATRKVDIPKQIEKLNSEIKSFNVTYKLLYVVILIHLLWHLIFG